MHDSSPEATQSIHANEGQLTGQHGMKHAVEALFHRDSGGEGEGASNSDGAGLKLKNIQAAYLLLMFPFAVLMILGPGFMSTILIAVGDNSHLIVLGALSALVGITFVVFLFAGPIRQVLGAFGMNILLRLVGLIVIILAFQIMAAGLVKLLPGLAG